jgi:hypothetical protein
MLLLGLYSLDCKDYHVVSSNYLRPKIVIPQNSVFHYCKHDLIATNCYIFGNCLYASRGMCTGSIKMNNTIV